MAARQSAIVLTLRRWDYLSLEKEGSLSFKVLLSSVPPSLKNFATRHTWREYACCYWTFTDSLWDREIERRMIAWRISYYAIVFRKTGVSYRIAIERHDREFRVSHRRSFTRCQRVVTMNHDRRACNAKIVSRSCLFRVSQHDLQLRLDGDCGNTWMRATSDDVSRQSISRPNINGPH